MLNKIKNKKRKNLKMKNYIILMYILTIIIISITAIFTSNKMLNEIVKDNGSQLGHAVLNNFYQDLNNKNNINIQEKLLNFKNHNTQDVSFMNIVNQDNKIIAHNDKSRLNKYSTNKELMMKLINNGGGAELINTVKIPTSDGEIKKKFYMVSKSYRIDNKPVVINLGIKIDKMLKVKKAGITKIISFIISFSIISLIVVTLFINKISKVLNLIVIDSKQMSKGDFSKTKNKLKTKVKEIINIDYNFNNMKISLIEIFSHIINNADKTLKNSKSLHKKFNNLELKNKLIESNINSVLTNTEENTANLEEINASVEEIKTNSNSLNDEVVNTSKKITEIKDNLQTNQEEHIQENKKNIDKYIIKKEQVKKNCNEMINQIKNVGEIQKQLNEITKRTNLLSLNASIESARVGNAGKGFSVIANEIRSLSQQSERNLKEIEPILNDTNKAIQLLVKNINEVLEDTMKYLNKNETFILNNNTFVNTNIDFIDNYTEKIQIKTTDLKEILNQISIAISDTSKNVQNNCQQVESISQEIENSNEITQELKQDFEQGIVNSKKMQENLKIIKF